MNFKSSFLAGAMVALLGSQPLLANPITVTYNGSAQLGTGSGVGYETGMIYPGPGGNGNNVSIGGISFNSASAGSFGLPLGPFDAWCVDIGHWLATPTSTFTVSPSSTLASTLAFEGKYALAIGQARVADLNKLANAYYDTLDTLTESAAFQLAVWAITYGQKGALGYSINSTDVNPSFHVNSGTVTSAWGVQANSWLSTLDAAASTSNYNIVYLSDASVSASATQDMVVFVKTGSSTVPEPGTIALLGIGLLAVSLIQRRRR